MKKIISALPAACVLAAFALTAHAQGTGNELNPIQQQGRQVFAQSCGVCHLAPSANAKTYGPSLNKTSAAGNDEVMRAFIVNGTDRMPAFKYYLKPAEIDAIIAYVRTLPAPVVRAANEPQK